MGYHISPQPSNPKLRNLLGPLLLLQAIFWPGMLYLCLGAQKAWARLASSLTHAGLN